MKREIGLTEARGKLSEIVNEVFYQGSSYVISKQGKPAAALVPLAVLEAYVEGRRQRFNILRQLQEKNAGNDPDELLEAALEAQAAVRAGSFDVQGSS